MRNNKVNGRKEKRQTPLKSRKDNTDKPKKNEKKVFKKDLPEKKTFKKDSIEKPVIKKGFKPDEKIRLNRFLSNSGVCSRREADTLISSGCVSVNGKIVSELGTKVSLNDDVRFNGQQLNPERKVYLLFEWRWKLA